MTDIPKNVYLFYIIGSIRNEELYDWLCYERDGLEDSIIKDSMDEEDIFFYGYTTSKKIAKKFMMLRDPTKVIYLKKPANQYFQTIDEYETFKRQFRRMEISEQELLTRGSSNSEEAIVSVKMCITQFEKEYIDMTFESLDDRLYEMYNELPKINIIFQCFTEDMKKCLCDIGLIDVIYYLKYMYGDGEFTNMSAVCADEVFCLLDYVGELFVKGGKL